DPEGHVDRRPHAEQGGFAVPVPRRRIVGADVHLPGPADLLRRIDRRLERRGVVRHSGPHDRGRKDARRRQYLDADRDRPRPRRARRGRRGDRALRPRRRGQATGMTRRGRGVLVTLIAVVALAAPAAALAHAYLIKTFPSASTILDTPPSIVALTFDEAVEPR